MTRVDRRGICALWIVLLAGPVLEAQIGGGALAPSAPAAATPDVPKDALGRDTPRGTLLGFIRASREGNDEAASAYLDTNQRDQAAMHLARQLFVVLDTRLPARINDVSDRPEGALSNPLKPNVDLIGTVASANGPLDVLVERVNRNGSKIWLFSASTLEAIPDVYDEIDVVNLDRHLPRPLTKLHIFGIRLFDWVVLFCLIPLSYRLLGLLATLLNPILDLWRRRYAPTTAGRREEIPGFVRLLLIAVAIRWLVAIVDLSLIERQFWWTTTAMFAIVAVVWVLLLANARGEQYLRRRLAASGHSEIAAPLRLVRRLADVLVVSVGTIVTLRFYGVDPTAALAGLGIGGIAVALAAQKTLENVIGGLSIIFDKAVRVGDFLKFGDTSGTVDYIGLRSTRIRTLDRTVLSVPNGQIANVGIETISSRDKFWFHHFIGLRYDTTPQQLRIVIEGTRKLLASDASVELDSVRVKFFRIGPFSLDLELFAYLYARDWVQFLEIQEALLIAFIEIVERAGTSLAIPAQTTYFADAVTGGRRIQDGALASALVRRDAVT